MNRQTESDYRDKLILKIISDLKIYNKQLLFLTNQQEKISNTFNSIIDKINYQNKELSNIKTNINKMNKHFQFEIDNLFNNNINNKNKINLLSNLDKPQVSFKKPIN